MRCAIGVSVTASVFTGTNVFWTDVNSCSRQTFSQIVTVVASGTSHDTVGTTRRTYCTRTVGARTFVGFAGVDVVQKKTGVARIALFGAVRGAGSARRTVTVGACTVG